MVTRRRWLALAGRAAVVAATAAAGLAHAQEKSEKDKDRDEVRQMARETLERLYAVMPGARQVVRDATGYAVFSNFGLKIFVAGGGSGKGLVVQHKPRREVFMRMVEVQAGLGFGIKKFSAVFVFTTPEALEGFADAGWEFGGQGTAAATDGKGGLAFQGALQAAPGVWVYQLTDKGLALELTVKGTRYFRDGSLN